MVYPILEINRLTVTNNKPMQREKGQSPKQTQLGLNGSIKLDKFSSRLVGPDLHDQRSKYTRKKKKGKIIDTVCLDEPHFSNIHDIGLIPSSQTEMGLGSSTRLIRVLSLLDWYATVGSE